MKSRARDILLYLLLLLASCSMEMGGGASDTETGGIAVIGQILDSLGNGSEQVKVTLVPFKHNPVKDSAIPDSLTVVTDSNGLYSIGVKFSGNFNIEAVHLVSGDRVLIKGITIGKDTIILNPDTLRVTNSLEVIIPDSLKDREGYGFIRGTTGYRNFSAGAKSVCIDSIPIGLVEDIFLETKSGPHYQLLITDSVTIDEIGETTIGAGLIKTLYSIVVASSSFKNIKSIKKENSNTLWVGNDGGELFRYRATENEWQVYNFFGYVIYQIDIDQEGLLWLASSNGLYSFNGSNFSSHHTMAGQNIYQDVKSINVDQNNTKWVVFDQWVFYGDKDNWKKKQYSLPNGTSSYRDILIDKSGRIWIGTFGNGLTIDYGSHFSLYTKDNSDLPSDTIYTIKEDNSGVIWLGTANGIAKVEDSINNVTIYSNSNGSINFDKITYLEFDDSDNLWFIGDSSTVVNFNESDEYTSEFLFDKNLRIENIQSSESGALFIGGYGAGLLKFKTW